MAVWRQSDAVDFLSSAARGLKAWRRREAVDERTHRPAAPMRQVSPRLLCSAGADHRGCRPGGVRSFVATLGTLCVLSATMCLLLPACGSSCASERAAVPDQHSEQPPRAPRVPIVAPPAGPISPADSASRWGIDESELRGEATWYGQRHHGRTTASGEPFDMHDHTAAHKTLPFGAVVRVTRDDTRQSVVVRINDRGPYGSGRVIDLSRAAAEDIDLIRPGHRPVSIEILSLPE